VLKRLEEELELKMLFTKSSNLLPENSENMLNIIKDLIMEKAKLIVKI